MHPMNVPAKFEVRIALLFPELIGGSPKIWGCTWLCPHSLFPRKILYAYHTDYSTLYALVFPRFSIGVSGGSCESRFWGKGWGWYHSKERWWVPISPPYILFLYEHSFARNFRLQFWVGLWTPNFEEGEAVGLRGWYRSKECWWVPIGSPQ